MSKHSLISRSATLLVLCVSFFCPAFARGHELTYEFGSNLYYRVLLVTTNDSLYESSRLDFVVSISFSNCLDGGAEAELTLYNLKNQEGAETWSNTCASVRLDKYCNIKNLDNSTHSEEELVCFLIALSECFVGLPPFDIKTGEAWKTPLPVIPAKLSSSECFCHRVYSVQSLEGDNAKLASYFDEFKPSHIYSDGRPISFFESRRDVAFSLDHAHVVYSKRATRAHSRIADSRTVVDGRISCRILSSQQVKELIPKEKGTTY